MTLRRGLSLVELLVAFAILGVGLTSIFHALWVGKGEFARMDVLLCGRLLAQSVMDQTVTRWRNQDTRYFRLDSSPSDLIVGAASGAWKRPFEQLARARTRVVLDDGRPGAYFDPQLGPAWPDRFHPAELEFWKGFSYEIRVGPGGLLPGAVSVLDIEVSPIPDPRF